VAQLGQIINFDSDLDVQDMWIFSISMCLKVFFEAGLFATILTAQKRAQVSCIKNLLQVRASFWYQELAHCSLILSATDLQCHVFPFKKLLLNVRLCL